MGTGKAASVLFGHRPGGRKGLGHWLVKTWSCPPRHEETLETIRAEGGEASVFQADVDLEQGLHTTGVRPTDMVQAAVERYGGVHVLLNNVGILGPGDVVEVGEEVWDRVVDVNLKSMVLTSKFAVPEMARGGGGSVINVSSIAGLRAGSRGSSVAYSASKGGVIALTKTMAVTHGRDNIRVNCIAPGHIYTPMVAGSMSEERRDQRRRAGPLGTEGTAWDVAWAALFLASDEARWISGVVLPVDAGLLATTPLAMLEHLQ